MLGRSCAPAWGSLLCLHRWKKRDNNNTAGNSVLPSLCLELFAAGPLTNSFSDHSRWTRSPLRPFPKNSCHFTRPPSLCSAHAGNLSSKFRAFSPAEILLSPPPNFLTPARPVLQQQTRCWEVELCRQRAEMSLSALQVASLSATRVQMRHLTKLIYDLELSIRSVQSPPASFNILLASDFCVAAVGQETIFSSDCASSRLESSWAELHCHIITPNPKQTQD